MKYKIATWNITSEYLSLLSPILAEDGIEIVEACDSHSLYQLLTERSVHLLLADVFSKEGLAWEDTLHKTGTYQGLGFGFAQIAALHSLTSLPLLILSSQDDLMTKITALDTGADEFVSAKINVLELHARISALLRRSYQLPSYLDIDHQVYVVRDLKLNDISKKTYVDGKEKKLTPIEYRILRLLLSKKGKPVSSQEIYKTIWKMNAINTDNVVAVHMRHLRKKIETQPENPSYLKVVRGMGYMIV